MDESSSGPPVTVAECRQAIRVHEWELLRLVSDLAERRRQTVRHRRGLERGRRACAKIWKQCRDRVEAIELMRDLVRSSPDGVAVSVEAPLQPVPAGVALLEQVGAMMHGLDTEDETALREFFRRLGELQELAKDFFDYRGVQLVYELGETLNESRQASVEKLRELLHRVERLRAQASEWPH